MHFYVLTLFPEMIRSIINTSITGRAVKNGFMTLDTVNIRDFSTRKTNRVDDYPYGGGAGMVMEAEPVYQAIRSVEERIGHKPRVVYMTPQAKVLNQTKVEELAREKELVLLCGHYEGIDERVLEEMVTDYISIGDYVLTGGELGAAVLIDAVSRFVPGVLSNEESSQFESLQDNLLEYPQYTRPEVWHDKAVPEVLLSGDHNRIEAWRHEQSIARTGQRRPDLLASSYRVTCMTAGRESCALTGSRLLEKVTRYGSFMDYNRRKLQKTRKTMEKDELLLLVLDSDSLAAESDAEAFIPPEERFRNLYGERTPVVIVSADGSREGLEKLQIFLQARGFSVYEEELLPEEITEDVLTETALNIRKKTLQ